MKYICVEDHKICGVMDYEPNVPDTVRVTIITNDEHQLLTDRTHYFDIPTETVLPYDSEALEQFSQAEINAEKVRFLLATDWKVMRHIREKALRIPTSLSEDEYFDLEMQRHDAASAIKR